MSYTPNIPQATDNPSNSQPLILANFQQLNTQFGTDPATGLGGDHVFFTSVTNNGKHNRVTLLDESAAIPAVKQAGADQILIYGKTNSGVTMPYYTRDNIALATTEFSLAPIKAYASFTSIAATGTQNITPDDSFNINTPIVQVSGTPYTFTFTLTNACRTMVYGINFSIDLSGVNILFPQRFPGYSITSSTIFVITVPFLLASAKRFTVTVLES